MPPRRAAASVDHAGDIDVYSATQKCELKEFKKWADSIDFAGDHDSDGEFDFEDDESGDDDAGGPSSGSSKKVAPMKSRPVSKLVAVDSTYEPTAKLLKQAKKRLKQVHDMAAENEDLDLDLEHFLLMATGVAKPTAKACAYADGPQMMKLRMQLAAIFGLTKENGWTTNDKIDLEWIPKAVKGFKTHKKEQVRSLPDDELLTVDMLEDEDDDVGLELQLRNVASFVLPPSSFTGHFLWTGVEDEQVFGDVAHPQIVGAWVKPEAEAGSAGGGPGALFLVVCGRTMDQIASCG